MYKKKIDDFLEGNLNINEFEKTNLDNTEKHDFIHSYKNVIAESNANVPDFNPFEKIESQKKKRLSSVRRFLPYAASILLVLSFIVILQNNPTKNKFALSDPEIAELQHNTEQALLCFSKELNACIAEIDKEQKTRQSFAEMYSINHFRIDFDNPTKNIKIN